MRILFLTNNENTYDLAEWLINNAKEEVIIFDEKIYLERIKQLNPDFIISFNYKYIIKKDVIDYLKNKVINLHISYLPWNKGAYPNLWSFIENTPKGVTIHLIDEGIDTGDILCQKEVEFDDYETLVTSYNILLREIKELFKENWEFIKSGKIIPQKQKGNGTFHTKKDFENIKYLLEPELWNLTIKQLKERLKKC